MLAEDNGNQSVFNRISLPEFTKDNCFTQNLYFMYEDGVLITTQYGDFWTDTHLPDTHLLDVSEYFKDIIESKIKKFSFDSKVIEKGKSRYGQPITSIEMSNGKKIKFSINFGEVETCNYTAFYEILSND